MFFNRLKIFLTLLIILFLSILFWQNQELLALKLLCPNVEQTCLYQTIPLPLSLWMFIFIMVGILTSLIWQFLNYLSNGGSNRSKSSTPPRYEPKLDNPPPEKKFTNTQSTKQTSSQNQTTVKPKSTTNYMPKSDWEDNSSNDDWTTEESTQNKVVDRVKERPREDSSKTQRSDTTYSYKSRPDSQEQEQKIDRVYDASYRVINPALKKNYSDTPDNRQSDDDEEWI
ncbi:MAG: hypothetical protein AB4368_05140 [Xenococcaceae cyanobacterium]